MAEESPKDSLKRIVADMAEQIAAVFSQRLVITNRRAAQKAVGKAQSYVEALQEARWEGFESDLIKTAKAVAENPSILLLGIVAIPYGLATGERIIGAITPNWTLERKKGSFQKAVDGLPDRSFQSLMQEFARVAGGVRDLEFIKSKIYDAVGDESLRKKTKLEGEALDRLADAFRLSAEDRAVMHRTYETSDFDSATWGADFIPKLRDGLADFQRRLSR